MKKLFLRIALFGVFLVVGMISVFFITGELLHNSRLGATYHKHDRLSSINIPRLILIGGSNAHYGINSALLERLSGRPVVNMSIQGSIGLRYMFAEVTEELREGDIVVLLAENSHFFKGHVDGENSLFRLISIYPSGIKYLHNKQIMAAPFEVGPAIGENFSNIMTNLVMRMAGRKTVADAANIQGDYLGHKGKKSKYVPKDFKFSTEKLSDYTLSFLKDARIEVESKKASLFLGFVPVAMSDSNKDGYYKIERALPEDITLGQMKNYIYPDSFFYDFAGHLMYDKRDIRTEQLYKDLMNNVSAEKALSNGG